MTGLRISYITAGFPFPLSSGYLRHHHLLRALAPDHSVRLRSLAGPDFVDDDRAGLEGIVEDVAVFRDAPRPRVRRAVDQARPEHRPAVRDLRAAIATDVADGVDVVVLSGKDTASVLDVVPSELPLVIDLCDATSARATQELDWASPSRRAVLRVRRARLRRVERDLVERGDVLLAASARDRDLLIEEGAPARVQDAMVVPNGIDTERWDRRTPQLGDAVALCANLGYRPNADAARYLVGTIMPRVWTHRPDTPVLVIGTGASRALAAELADPRVTLTGTVDDVRPYLEQAAVVAAPLRAATGIQNKLLEALALQIRVVTSSVAANGLGPEAPLVVADEPEAFATAVLEHLDGSRQPDAAARRWVGARFSWGRSGQLLAQALARAVDREPARW